MNLSEFAKLVKEVALAPHVKSSVIARDVDDDKCLTYALKLERRAAELNARKHGLKAKQAR